MGIGETIGTLFDKAYDNTLIPGLDVAESVTVTLESDASYNVSTGANSGTPDAQSVNALIGEVTAEEVATSEGLYKIGDLRISIQADSSITESTLDNNTVITYRTRKYRVVDIRTNVINNTLEDFDCVCRQI